MGLAYQLPFRLGAGDDTQRQEHRAILDALAEGDFDTSEGSPLWCETYGEATAVAIAWACNRRLANQRIPTRMLEALTTWEEACGLRPTISDSDYDRRARLAAKLRGLCGNALVDIVAAVTAILGNNYHSVVLASPATEITYWPGVNPGPPGYEWSSNRARLGVRMTEDGLSAASFNTKRLAVMFALDAMLPAWMNFCIGTGSGFTTGLGFVGKTLL